MPQSSPREPRATRHSITPVARPAEVDGRDAARKDRVVPRFALGCGERLGLAGASGEAPLPGVTASLGGRTAARAPAIAVVDAGKLDIVGRVARADLHSLDEF